MTVIERDELRVADLVGLSLGTHTATYEERDSILYALAVGARAEERELVDEQRLRVLSTYGLALGLWAVQAAGRTGAYDPVRTLHVSQRLAVHAPLPASGAIEMEGRIAAVWDKRVAALIEVTVSSPYFDATYGIWVPGAGEFGGERGPSAGGGPAADAPDLRLAMATTPDQAALYRLTGDLHPLHIDPDVAQAAGFDRPILHGLCVLGASVLTLARAVGADATRVRELAVRFAAPVYPGATIDLAGWSAGPAEPVRFGATVDEADVLKAGRVSFGTVER